MQKESPTDYRGPPCPHQPLHDKINPKKCQVLSLGDSGFLQFFRVVSRDGKANPDYRRQAKPLDLFNNWLFTFVVPLSRKIKCCRMMSKRTVDERNPAPART